MLIIRF